MIPYLELPTLAVAGIRIPAFALFAWAASWAGYELAAARARRLAVERRTAAGLAACVVAGGWLGSHLVALGIYRSADVMRDPRLLLEPWQAMSSWGGIAGALGAGWLAGRGAGLPARQRLRFLDAVAWAFPFAWTIGRLGCALAHDHPGVRSSSWLAVRDPAGARLDTGLLELLLALVLAGAVAVAGRRRTRPGGLAAGVLVAYAGGRFALEALRVGEPHWGALTFGQVAALGALPVAGLLATAHAPGRARAWRIRGLALLAVAAFLAALRWIEPEPAARGAAQREIAIALGYGHLLGGALALGRRALPRRPAGVSPWTFGAFLVSLGATGFVLYRSAAAFSSLPVLALLALSIWHVLENDLALGRAAGPRLPRPSRRPAVRAALALAACLPAALVRETGAELGAVLAVATLYHVASWVLHLATAPGPRSCRHGLVWPHGLALLLLAASAGSGGALAEARTLVLAPSTFLFFAALHVLHTSARRLRPIVGRSPPILAAR